MWIIQEKLQRTFLVISTGKCITCGNSFSNTQYASCNLLYWRAFLCCSTQYRRSCAYVRANEIIEYFIQCFVLITCVTRSNYWRRCARICVTYCYIFFFYFPTETYKTALVGDQVSPFFKVCLVRIFTSFYQEYNSLASNKGNIKIYRKCFCFPFFSLSQTTNFVPSKKKH